MAKFINIPPLDIAEEAEQWILTEDCIYQSDLPKDGKEIKVLSVNGHVEDSPVLVTVYTGFPTDLASIPRIFRFLIVKNGKHRAAAIVHDFLCRLKLHFPRVLADHIFLEAMLISGENRIRARLMFAAVRINTARLKLFGKAT